VVEFQWDPNAAGQWSAPVEHVVAPTLLQAFCAAASPGSDGSAAPPTFLGRFQSLSVPGLDLPLAGLIHTEQEFTYELSRPVRAGDRVRVVGCLEAVRERSRLAMVVVRNRMTVTGAEGADPVGVVETRSTVMVTLQEGAP
jgi:hypothetical protein